MGFLSKAFGQVSGAFGSILGIDTSSPDLGASAQEAFDREQERLRIERDKQDEEARFRGAEGEGVARTADFEFGDQFDLEELSTEERTQRSSGRLSSPTDTGLIL